jgi:hypothetical protein
MKQRFTNLNLKNNNVCSIHRRVHTQQTLSARNILIP